MAGGGCLRLREGALLDHLRVHGTGLEGGAPHHALLEWDGCPHPLDHEALERRAHARDGLVAGGAGGDMPSSPQDSVSPEARKRARAFRLTCPRAVRTLLSIQ